MTLHNQYRSYFRVEICQMPPIHVWGKLKDQNSVEELIKILEAIRPLLGEYE